MSATKNSRSPKRRGAARAKALRRGITAGARKGDPSSRVAREWRQYIAFMMPANSMGW